MTTGGEAVKVSVLGPIRVVDGAGSDVTPTGDLVRRLLAFLVLHRGRRVSVDAAVDVLWPTTLPARPAAALQNLVLRVRRVLPDGAVEFVDNGYRLDATSVEVDADGFAQALLMGDDIDAASMSVIDGVLDRWRGTAYPELDDVEEGRAEAMRLDEQRIRAIELTASSRIAAGDAAEAVTTLLALVDEQPLRERPRALLISALAQTGRHPEALRVYDEFRRLLGDELGIEPSPALAAQYADVLSGVFPTRWSVQTRLPARRTSLLGRDDLLASTAAMVATGRPVTLVGPGGVGKTRLLVELGHCLLDQRPDCAVVQCELASADADTAVDVIASALGIDARPGLPLAERVVGIVGNSELVLLLDNCEHVLAPVADLVELLLAECVGVCVVATSRERLRVRGEHVQVVPTLAVGTVADPAVELFVERAQAAAPDFAPDRADLEQILEIVSRLDGLPLAIELAAARMHTGDLTEVVAGLGDRLALLSSGYRASSRHGSLATTVAWSFELLDERLRTAFSDLSILSRSFDVADAAAVCGIDEASVAPLLTQLVEQSLVARAPGGRYTMLETLRAYAAEQLALSGRLDVVSRRHAIRQVEWAATAVGRSALHGEHALAEIDDAIAEIRTGLDWLIDHHEFDLAESLVTSLWLYGFMRLRPDVLAWSERLLAAGDANGHTFSSEVWVVAAYAAWMAGDVGESGRRSEHALRLAGPAGSVVPTLVAMALASFELFEGRVREAADWYRSGADTARDDAPTLAQMARGSEVLALGYAGDPLAEQLAGRLLTELGEMVSPHAAYVWYCTGEAALSLGDIDRARLRLERAVELADRTNASFVVGTAGASKASIAARSGDPELAAAEYRSLITHWRRAGMWSTQWTMMRTIAILLARLDRPGDAAVLEGAIRATAAGHRIFGADAAAMDGLTTELRDRLGVDEYERARGHGATLDGGAAADYALRALTPSSTG